MIKPTAIDRLFELPFDENYISQFSEEKFSGRDKNYYQKSIKLMRF